ncbi:MAG: TetR/AcrR family transcriptional regulator [Novosphingobium sp.]|nr:TetR/AcrR family transcriptional regulator [Novosphingobium sp.]
MPRISRPSSMTDDLVDAAEALFATRSIDATSLREIGLKAGSANKNVVRYHFGDREGLIRAIFTRRLAGLERARGDLLKDFTASGREPTDTELLTIIFRPIAELKSPQGKRIYAGFLRNNLSYRRPPYESWAVASEIAPLTDYVMSLLRARYQDLPDDLFVQRMHSITVVFLDIVVALDDGAGIFTEQEGFAEAMSLAIAILRAPAPAQEHPER